MSDRTAYLPVFSSMMRPIATPATGARNGTPASHHRQRAAADRGHRRRAVRFEDVRHDANRVGERFLGRQHRQKRALGERAVADFAAAGAAQELHFAYRERREVVVQHEPAIDLALDGFDLLLVVRRAERHGDERLRFAAREHGRAVHAGQHADFRPDRPDLVELAAVETHALLEHFVAQHLLLELLEDGLRFDLALHFAFGNRSDELAQHLIDRAVVGELVAHAHGVGERNHHLLFHFAVEGRVVLPSSRLRASACRLPSRARRSSRRCA